MDDWKDPQTARNWDADPLSHNPTRVEQLDILLSLVEDEHTPGEAILDIGMGSGIVEEMLLRRVPDAYVVGIDSSEAMLELARRRLQPYSDRYAVVMHDLSQIEAATLPAQTYSIVISVQTIHNVADEHKVSIFRFVHRTLQEGGLFLLMDRIAVDTPQLFSTYLSLWKRLDRVHGARTREGETFEEHGERVKARGDLPAGLEWHLQQLRAAGFEAACLHLHANRALLAARKV